MRKENGLIIFECDKDENGKEILNSSQRNNQLVWPSVKSKPKAQYRTNWSNMCNVTSMVMGLEYAGFTFPDGPYNQPEDNLGLFILTDRELLEKWKRQAPAQYDLFIKSQDGKLTKEQVDKYLYFPTELHDYLSLGVNRWLGTKATKFSTSFSFKKLLELEMVFGNSPIVISTTFGGFGHIICCTGVAYKDGTIFSDKEEIPGPTPEGIYVDDPWGKYNPATNKYDAHNGGNDIFIPWDVVVKRVKPANSEDVKWMHLFYHGLAAV